MSPTPLESALPDHGREDPSDVFRWHRSSCTSTLPDCRRWSFPSEEQPVLVVPSVAWVRQHRRRVSARALEQACACGIKCKKLGLRQHESTRVDASAAFNAQVAVSPTRLESALPDHGREDPSDGSRSRHSKCMNIGTDRRHSTSPSAEPVLVVPSVAWERQHRRRRRALARSSEQACACVELSAGSQYESTAGVGRVCSVQGACGSVTDSTRIGVAKSWVGSWTRRPVSRFPFEPQTA
jgi:hypothetical protein